MVVRSTAFDIIATIGCALLVWGGISFGLGPDVYSRQCTGRYSWMCELIKEAKSFELFGFNPVLLGLVLTIGWFGAFSFTRLGCGWTAKLVDEEVWILGLAGISRVPVDDIANVEVKPRIFGSIAHFNLTTKDLRRFSASNANVKDANKLAKILKVRTRALPTTPPAT